VAEDTLEQNEKEAVYDELKAVYPPFEGMIPDEDLKRGKGIVGLFTVELKKESKFIGKFQTAGMYPSQLIIATGIVLIKG